VVAAVVVLADDKDTDDNAVVVIVGVVVVVRMVFVYSAKICDSDTSLRNEANTRRTSSASCISAGAPIVAMPCPPRTSHDVTSKQMDLESGSDSEEP